MWLRGSLFVCSINKFVKWASLLNLLLAWISWSWAGPGLPGVWWQFHLQAQCCSLHFNSTFLLLMINRAACLCVRSCVYLRKLYCKYFNYAIDCVCVCVCLCVSRCVCATASRNLHLSFLPYSKPTEGSNVGGFLKSGAVSGWVMYVYTTFPIVLFWSNTTFHKTNLRWPLESHHCQPSSGKQ